MSDDYREFNIFALNEIRRALSTGRRLNDSQRFLIKKVNPLVVARKFLSKEDQQALVDLYVYKTDPKRLKWR